jgi:hypothetical protein
MSLPELLPSLLECGSPAAAFLLLSLGHAAEFLFPKV